MNNNRYQWLTHSLTHVTSGHGLMLWSLEVVGIVSGYIYTYQVNVHISRHDLVTVTGTCLTKVTSKGH